MVPAKAHAQALFLLKWHLLLYVLYLFRLHGREVRVVGEAGERFLASETPGQVVVVGDETHVVSVYSPEGCQAVTHDGE